MARISAETLHDMGDRIKDVGHLVIDRADIVVEYLDRENGPIDRVQANIVNAQDWLFDKAYDWASKGRNK